MSMPGRRLIDAFLAGDTSSAAALLAPAATFHSPIRDYTGADQIDSVWRAVAGVLQNAQSTSVFERNRESVSFFTATIRDRPVAGALRALTDEEGRVWDISLLLRPWGALKAGISDISLVTE